MTTARFIWRSLIFYRRTHAGLFLGAALAAMILTGALTVGDSVRYSLRQIALARLGGATLALSTPAHFVREELGNLLQARLEAPVAPLLLVRGTVALPDGRARANEVQIVGVEERFWSMGGAAGFFSKVEPGSFAANRRLTTQLGLKVGDAVVIRVEKPSLLSREAPLSGARDASVALRAQMTAVAGDGQFGRFSLQANQVPPLTVFVPLHWLQTSLEQPGRVNALLIGRGKCVDATQADAALKEVWTLADLALEVREVRPAVAELHTDRVFLDPAIAAAALKAAPGAAGALTYLVNEIRFGDRSTPYSMVTATDAADGVPPLAADEIAINSWLAADLAAKPGDLLALRYFVLRDNGSLAETTSRFRVRAVLPLTGADASWMPPFPGLANVENCRDWEPGLPLDLNRIRPKDEQYWKTYRGTPKAFVSLRAGQALFQNRFGSLTAIRYPLAGGASADDLARAVRHAIDPQKAGLFFQPVGESARTASGGSQDFGQLFAGFSFFLIVAALLLMAMLFVFSLEQRAGEAGLLIALGFTERRVRRLFLLEGYAVAALGTLAGVAAGAGYARLALHGLSTVWRDAVHFSEFRYHAEPLTLLIGAASSLVMGGLVTWIAGRGARGTVYRGLRERRGASVLVSGPIQPGGLLEISRGLSAAIPPVHGRMSLTPEGVAEPLATDSNTPAGVNAPYGSPGVIPPANFRQPSGLRRQSGPSALIWSRFQTLFGNALAGATPLRRRGAGASSKPPLVATELPGQSHSQTEFGNEGASDSVRNGAPGKTCVPARWSRCWVFGALCTAGALALLAAGARSAEAFFEAGALLLIAGIAFSYGWLVSLSKRTGMARRLTSIGVRGASRRIGRSLTVIALLASGIFMVVAAGAFREDPLQASSQRASGTGGFALFGQSTLPIYEDLNSQAGRAALGLGGPAMQAVSVVPMRMKEGDEASCLNLNRAQQPRFLGVQPQELASRKAFAFVDSLPGGAGWSQLERVEPGGAVPAIGDEATVRWALGKSVGDTFQATDERGAPFQVRIVGIVSDSILQGSLVLGEPAFRLLFPSSGGGRVFLIDAPRENAGEAAQTLSRALQGRGLEVVPAWRRLADFQAVENSYLSIFQALGGLGLLLGSAGLGIVVMRNVFERRNELALLQAVGFSPGAVRLVVLSEHWLLVALGAGIGGAAALVGIFPSLFGPQAGASLGGALVTLGVLTLSGAAWCWLAAWQALRGPLIDALRNE